MPYTKLIRAGDLVEEYTYQFEPAFKDLRKPRERIKRFTKVSRSEANIKSSRRSFHRLVRANLGSDRPPPILMTLTYSDNVTDIDISNKIFNTFTKRLRYDLGKDISWISVPEFQKRGAVHYHVLLFGVSHEYVKSERSTRYFASLWTRGFVDVITTDGSSKLATYLAKYMSKALADFRLIGKRGYSASHNILRPVFLNTPFQVEYAREDWSIGGVDNPPDKRRIYDTKWLGRCDYKRYTIQHENSSYRG
jgi:hypothetical protein